MQATEKIKTIECPDCGGAGSFIEDYHDPMDYYGHGQREYKCERCLGTGEVDEDDVSRETDYE